MSARVVTLGESMALVTPPGLGGFEHAHAVELRIGGAEGNVAIGIARLGGDASWLGRVGDDALGRRVVRELRAEGVDVHAVVDRDAPTGLMVKDRPTATSTRVGYYRAGSAGSRLSPEDLDRLDIDGAAVLHVTGITPALSKVVAAAVDAATMRARAAGVLVSFDVNHRAGLWRGRDPQPVYRRLAESSDVLFAGEDEARLLVGDEVGTGDDLDGLLDAMAALGPEHVLLKLGAEGCLARIDGRDLRRAAVPVSPVDTVGAGDAFVAGYLAALVAGEGAEARLDLAVRAGAFACLSAGDWEGLPRRTDLALLGNGGDPVQR